MPPSVNQQIRNYVNRKTNVVPQVNMKDLAAFALANANLLYHKRSNGKWYYYAGGTPMNKKAILSDLRMMRE
jgi:hypothetical protein